MTERQYIGKPARRVDAADKVTGRARYVADYHLPGMLYARCLRSEVPHARIVCVDTAPALQIPGVRAAITNADFAKEGRFGFPVSDQYMLAREHVRHVGEAIAAVAADTPEAAAAGVAAILCELEPLPAVFDSAAALEAGAQGAETTNHWAHRGKGALDLAHAVMAACDDNPKIRFTYDNEMSIKQKIEAVAKKIYLADRVVYELHAEQQIAQYEEAGMSHLPICMAKTQFSLSHDSKLKGVPRGFELPIRAVRASAGAGFVYPLVGEIRTMPGLGSKPAFMNIDIDENGEVVGMF